MSRSGPVTGVEGDRPDWITEALSEALRAAEREHDRRVEEMIRRYQSAPERWSGIPENNLPA